MVPSGKPKIKAVLRVLISGGILASAWLVVDMISSSPSASAAEVNEVSVGTAVDLPPIVVPPAAAPVTPPAALPVAPVSELAPAVAAVVPPTVSGPVAAVVQTVPAALPIVSSLPVVSAVLESLPLVSSILHFAGAVTPVPFSDLVVDFNGVAYPAPALPPTAPLAPAGPEPANNPGSAVGGAAGDRETSLVQLRPVGGTDLANPNEVLPNSVTFETDTTPD